MIVPSHLILCSWQPVHMCYNIWWCDTLGARVSANINVRYDHDILTTAGISAFKSHIPAFMCMIHVLKNKFALVYDSLTLCRISHEICTQFFALLSFPVIRSSVWCHLFPHIDWGCFTVIGAISWFRQGQSNNPELYGLNQLPTNQNRT